MALATKGITCNGCSLIWKLRSRQNADSLYSRITRIKNRCHTSEHVFLSGWILQNFYFAELNLMTITLIVSVNHRSAMLHITQTLRYKEWYNVLISWKKFFIVFLPFSLVCIYYTSISHFDCKDAIETENVSEYITIGFVRMRFFGVRIWKELVWHAARKEVTRLTNKDPNTVQWSVYTVHQSPFLYFLKIIQACCFSRLLTTNSESLYTLKLFCLVIILAASKNACSLTDHQNTKGMKQIT